MARGTDARWRTRPSLWHADAATAAALMALVALAAIAAGLARPLDENVAVVAAVVLATLPAALWLAFFYRRDRFEREPLTLVAGVFAVGVLLAAAVGEPLLHALEVDRWLGASTSVQLLGSVLVVGLVQETLKFVAVRAGIYGNAHFDGPTDGIVYGTAAGLGYGAVVNLAFALQSPPADLALTAIRVVLFALVHGALGGVVGYFLGRQAIGDRPAAWALAGVLLAAVLNGLFLVVRGLAVDGPVPIDGVDLGPWLGLALAAVLAVAVTVPLERLARRRDTVGRPVRRLDVVSVVAVAALAVVALTSALVLRTSADTATRSVTSGGLAFSVPAGWLVETTPDAVLVTARDPGNPAALLVVQELTAVPGTSLEGAASELVRQDRERSGGYSVVRSGSVALDGRDAFEVGYRVIVDDGGTPALASGSLVVVAVGERLVGVSVAVPADDADRGATLARRVAVSVTTGG